MENPRLQPLRIARIPAAILADATLLFWFIAACFNHSIAQDTGLRIDKNSVLGGLNGAQILLYETENDYARLRITNSMFNSNTNNRYWDIAGRIGPNNSGSEDRLNFFLNGVGDILSLRGTGRVGIGTISPTAKLDVRGRIRIDDDASSVPQPGTIRFNPATNDFEGWNGLHWASLSGLQYEIGSVTDVDGNTYPTVIIGTQEWMASNLITSKYRNGHAVIQVVEDSEWDGANYGAWCWYMNDIGYEAQYGKLYNWFAVNDTRGLCPSGWHVPSSSEWTTMINYLGGSSVAGGKLKEPGLTSWKTPNTGATNESGFTGKGGGSRDYQTGFAALGSFGYWWSNTESNSDEGFFTSLDFMSSSSGSSTIHKRFGFSVRCVKD